jgi:predicted MFS family arabinose efflux permease
VSLRHHTGFRKLWLGKTISSLGSQITFVALPLTAVLMLKASAKQMGLLTAAGTLPYLLFGLPAGAWVDRLPRRAILITADAGRAALLVTIPVAALLQHLRIGHLYLVAFLSGLLTLAYDVAEEAFLPALVHREQLVEGNSRMAAIDSVATIAGPSLGGGLVQALTAPIAIIVDVVSFVVSVTLLSSIRAVEPAYAPAERRVGLRTEIGEGLRFVLQHPLLRAVVGTSSTMQLFGGMFNALLALFLTQELALPPAALGLMYAIGSASGLMAAVSAGKLTRGAGVGRVIVAAALAIGAGWLVVASAHGTPAAAFATIGAGILVAGAGNTLYNINTASLSQAIAPDRLLGRVNATKLFIGWGALPVGSLVGGFLGEAIGLRATVLVAGVGLASGFLWVALSPVRTLVSLESADREETAREVNHGDQ